MSLGIDLRMCRNCGTNHPRTADCISVLRDRIAVLEFRIGSENGKQISQRSMERKARAMAATVSGGPEFWTDSNQ